MGFLGAAVDLRWASGTNAATPQHQSAIRGFPWVQVLAVHIKWKREIEEEEDGAKRRERV
jgi:hypothetical protein